MQTRKIVRICAVLILIIGIGIYTYPYITQWLYDQKVSEIVESFETEVNDPRLEELYQRMVEENKQMYEEGQKDLMDPFFYEQAGINLVEYGLTDNIVGYITIPKMKIKLPIYLGANEVNMKLGAVHLTQTSYPIGGTNTNCVLAAHRGYSKAVMFRKIELLEIGDSVEIRNFRETLNYRVVEIKVISPNDIEQILIQPNKELLTLMTCHPYPTNKLRYLVFCERVK